MEATKNIPLQNTVESIQKELADLAASQSKSIEAMDSYKGKNLFKTRAEADQFLNTPEAKKEKMVLWVVRKGGKMPCFMVDTPERIKLEKKNHKAMSKMTTAQKSVAMMIGVTGMIAAMGMHFIGASRKKKFLELKLQYAQELRSCNMENAVSDKIISILNGLAAISYKKADIIISEGTCVSIWLFGVRRETSIRKNLDLFDVQITIYLKNNDRNKVRHCQFDIYSPSQKYQFSWPKPGIRRKIIKFPWKTGFLDRPSLMINRLKRSIEYHQKPNEGVSNLYALTSIPNLRKVIPEVEQFLEKLYPQLFSHEDYMDWTSRRIKKTLDEVLEMKRTLAIPEEKPLAVGVDETSRVITCLTESLEKWHRQKKQRQL